MNQTRTAFFISDRTGITAENLGHSLLSQFEGNKFIRVRLPFLDTVDKARETTNDDAILTRALALSNFNSGAADEKSITELVSESHESCFRLRCPFRVN